MLGRRRLVASKWLGRVGRGDSVNVGHRGLAVPEVFIPSLSLLRLLVSTVTPVAAGSASAVIPVALF